MANNPNGQHNPADYHEIWAKKYIYLFGTAIHKRFFVYWTFTLWIFTWVATRFIGVDMLIAQWHLTNWWIFIPEATVIAGALFIWQREVTRTARIREREAAQQLAYAKKYIDTHLPEPVEVPGFKPEEAQKK